MQRIRYIKNDFGFESMRVLETSGGKEIKPFLSKDQLEGTIQDVDGTVYASVRGRIPHKTKIKIKRELVKLGAQFKKEERVSRKDRSNEKTSTKS